MDKIFTIKDRILYFIENQDIKKVDFFNKIGIASSNFKGTGINSEIGGSKIVKILTLYPQISAEWLLLGTGEMIKTNKQCIKINDGDLLLKRFEEVIIENSILKSEINELRKIISGESSQNKYKLPDPDNSLMAAEPDPNSAH